MSAPLRLAELHALRRALAEQRKALRAGAFAELSEISKRIGLLCDRLEQEPSGHSSVERALLSTVKAEAVDFLRELGAMLAGAKEAEALLLAHIRARETRTYDRAGITRSLAAEAASLNTRR